MRQPWQRWNSWRAQMIDPEGRDCDPGALLVGVESQHAWNQRAENFWRYRVMQKQQVVPALRHNPRRHGSGPGAMRCGKENGIGAHPPRPALFLSGEAVGGWQLSRQVSGYGWPAGPWFMASDALSGCAWYCRWKTSTTARPTNRASAVLCRWTGRVKWSTSA